MPHTEEKKIPKIPKKRGRPRKVLPKTPDTDLKEVPAKQAELSPQSSPQDAELPIVRAVKSDKYIYAVGRRKTAMAKIKAFEDKSSFLVNDKDFSKYFPTKSLQKIILAPLSLLSLDKKIGFIVFVSGGGLYSQAGALRLAISKALIIRNPEDKPTLKKAGYLTRDSRKKERKKPGLKRARRGPQWAKR